MVRWAAKPTLHTNSGSPKILQRWIGCLQKKQNKGKIVKLPTKAK
jgi:hypothetical protein